MSSVEERVVNIVAEQLGVDKDKIKPESNFVNDLGAEGLQLVQSVAKDCNDHVVLAKTLTFGFQIIGGDVQRFHERQGGELCRTGNNNCRKGKHL